MPDSQDYKSAMDKVTAGHRWKQVTREKMQAEAGAQKAARPRQLGSLFIRQGTLPAGKHPDPKPFSLQRNGGGELQVLCFLQGAEDKGVKNQFYITSYQ